MANAARSSRRRTQAAPAAASQTIYSPVADFEGDVLGVTFKKGVGTAGDGQSLSYFRRKGYGIGAPAILPGLLDTPMLPDRVQVGTKLRDASVDPRARDFMPPTNAGDANPHGPLVVSPEIHHEGPKGIRGGPVAVDSPKQQQTDETALAEAVLVEGQPHPAAVEPSVTTEGGSAAADAPAKNASQADWAAWAVSQGMDPDEAEAASRADLIEQYGE